MFLIIVLLLLQHIMKIMLDWVFVPRTAVNYSELKLVY
jgi:hypothetical protein